MNKKDLTDLGIAEDIAEKVIVLHGKDIESHKTKITELQGQADNAQNQLTEANKQIESFKNMKPEELQKAADDWKAKYEQTQQEAEANLAQVKFDHALESALVSAKAKNVKAVTSLLSRDALKLQEDGTILGLKEQLETIRKDNDFLFTSEAPPPPKIITGSNNQPVTGNAFMDAARRGAKLPAPTEQGK